jgi:hypothetical protein
VQLEAPSDVSRPLGHHLAARVATRLFLLRDHLAGAGVVRVRATASP